MVGTWNRATSYGAEHLLRLFVNLPMIIVHTSMDADSISCSRSISPSSCPYIAKEKHPLCASTKQRRRVSSHQLHIEDSSSTPSHPSCHHL